MASEQTTPKANKVSPITSEWRDDPPSVVDRFFTRFYKRKEGVAEDHLVLFHSNRICLVGLAPTHVAVQRGVESINFDIGHFDRSKNQVKGKSKKGGMVLQASSTLAVVKCRDGSEFKVESCIGGKLIEINERLLERPELIGVEGDGYVAVVLPKPEHCQRFKASLLTEEQYKNAC